MFDHLYQVEIQKEKEDLFRLQQEQMFKKSKQKFNTNKIMAHIRQQEENQKIMDGWKKIREKRAIKTKEKVMF